MYRKNSHKTVEGIARIGIDLAKSVFHLAAMDSRGRLLLQKRFTRSGLLEFPKLIKPCLAGMEACAGAHHLGGKMRDMGFDVRLMAPLPWRSKEFANTPWKSPLWFTLSSCTVGCCMLAFIGFSWDKPDVITPVEMAMISGGILAALAFTTAAKIVAKKLELEKQG